MTHRGSMGARLVDVGVDDLNRAYRDSRRRALPEIQVLFEGDDAL